MASIVLIAGSPSSPSRSLALLDYAGRTLSERGHATSVMNVRDLDPRELVYGQFDGATIRPALEQVAGAGGVVVATPVYKAAYTGVLKLFLDLLPQAGLAGKVVLPVASGGSPAHMLVVDYALRPVLAALGAYHVLNGVYLLDSQLDYAAGRLNGFTAPEAETRLHDGLNALDLALRRGEQSSEGAN
jgi:FMN reductase